MSPRGAERDRLGRIVAWARAIEGQLAEVRQRRLGEVHFRPGASGVSMIGLLEERPQRGSGARKNLTRLAANFDALFEKHCVRCEHKRRTPEKQLQSWMVSQAYTSARRFDMLHHEADGEPVLFVADEVAWLRDGTRRVCDLLGLQGKQPVAIELKSRRSLKCLVEQVTASSDYVNEHADLFSELYTAVLGRPISFEQPCAKWIVWPAVKGGARDPREAELAARGIRVASYTVDASGFRLHVGAPTP